MMGMSVGCACAMLHVWWSEHGVESVASAHHVGLKKLNPSRQT